MNNFEIKSLQSKIIDEHITFIEIQDFDENFFRLTILFKKNKRTFASINLIPLKKSNGDKIPFNDMIDFALFTKNSDYKRVEEALNLGDGDEEYALKMNLFLPLFSKNMIQFLFDKQVIKYGLKNKFGKIDDSCKVAIHHKNESLYSYDTIIKEFDFTEEDINKITKSFHLPQ